MNGGTKLIIPGLGGIYDALGPLSYAVARFVLGGIIMVHGYAKLFGGAAPIVANQLLAPMGFPAPLAWAYFIGILEFFGCAALAVGFLTRPIALMLTVEMAIVTFFIQLPQGYNEYLEYTLILLVLSAVYAANGGGRYSLDHLIGSEF
ncbi:MAG: DoxX family protein [Stellaceae bacterium]|jgi:putative oxidoreductase